ncbi:pyridoxamine kinase [Sedimentibacter sp. MB31-C6]|uniref:pyridoxamine kinase n=1 Tax=Sedimentibacter sp. MB31-C6 TaxID=3109366 RepID=UPI002DDD8B2C|nr:pyridoxamine kinase [Sedimentibacter sp. MB36-C1]WSI04690.1 pyridoxamine kinase [Sedimentibacter sp. MB36-C1]
MRIIPKVAAIHDMSGVGRCSMTVILPIMSALGCQVCPLPTAILSNHSEYKEFYFYDFTEHMKKYYNAWEKNNETFDCVYSGFIGSEKQINIMMDIIENVKLKNDALIVVDPVMGDHGLTYKTYTENMINKMNQLVRKADIITPNLTEASILLKKRYCNEHMSIENLKLYLKKLGDMGPRIIVITGVTTEEGEHINVCFDKKSNEFWKIPFDYVETRYPGTGDLFTALFVGYLFNDKKLPEALEKSSRFVSNAVLVTHKAQTSSSEGVLFEKVIKNLYEEVENYKYTKI